MARLYQIRRDFDASYKLVSNINNVYHYMILEWELEPLVSKSSFYYHLNRNDKFVCACKKDDVAYCNVIIVRLHLVGNAEIQDLKLIKG